MTDERLTGFINSLYKGNTVFLDELEKRALETGVPIIRKDTQAFLRFIIASHDPKEILEIGTATGFSCILMAEYSSEDTKITTIEKYEKRLPVAEENIRASGYSEKIELIKEDASEVLPSLQKSFDMIFIDAAKAQYPFYLKEADHLLKKGGIIVADNCLQGGDILESKFAVERRNRTIHKRMREFLKEITSSDEYTTAVLTLGDGVVVSVKR
ncbi:MAG: O-methyltransferase [Lachnospiraceae bacterium]|nr:O-methyltransferase [Lachnospiraceae bacterium]